MLGRERDSQVIEEYYEEYYEDYDQYGYGYFQRVQINYGVESFYCAECGLTLDGLDEIEAAELEDAFDREEDVQLDDYQEYGNE